ARQAGAGLVRHLTPDPAFVEEPVPVETASPNQVVWQEGLAIGTGAAASPSSLSWSLERPRFVYAIRLRFDFSNTPQQTAQMTMTFGLSDAGAAQAKRRRKPGSETRSLDTTRPGDRCTFLVNRTIDHFELIPDVQPFLLRLSQVTLLIPEQEDAVR